MVEYNVYVSEYAKFNLCYLVGHGRYDRTDEFHFFQSLPPHTIAIIYIEYGYLTVCEQEMLQLLPPYTFFLTHNSKFPALTLKSGEKLRFHVLYVNGDLSWHLYQNYQSNYELPFTVLFPDNYLFSLFKIISSYHGRLLPQNELIISRMIIDLFSDLILVRNTNVLNIEIPDYLIAIKQLFDNRQEAPYTLDTLAQRFHVNKYKIIKDFQFHYGIPPMQYLTEQRLKTARQLLLSTTDTITQVAVNTGFSSGNYFIHFFKKKTGLSPTAYRRLYHK